jgi:2-succinyl-5-enolpyruvyl-6-hydroxy-3-cyclohexene-1-carboxylate synthase
MRWVQRVTSVRGLIVAGPALVGEGEGYAEKVLALARASGWPVLADALSPVRHFANAGDVVVVGAYDKILRDAAAARDLVPRHVIGLGAWPTSKVLREWLERAQAEMVLITPDAGSRDALHGRTREIVAPVEALVVEGAPLADGSYRAAWRAAEDAAAAALARPSDDGLWGEPEVTRALAAGLPDGAVVVVASSMPVRDVEYFWPVNTRGRRFFFSRGANGIDGTLSTALGVAHGSDAPVWLLTGDLALLHDTNGFLVAAQARGALTVVLINNNGGGIFEHLPVAGVGAAFEKFWGTPQRVDFGKLCAAYGVPHEVVADDERLAALLAEPVPKAGLSVWEVRTDRRRDARARKARLNAK